MSVNHSPFLESIIHVQVHDTEGLGCAQTDKKPTEVLLLTVLYNITVKRPVFMKLVWEPGLRRPRHVYNL